MKSSKFCFTICLLLLIIACGKNDDCTEANYNEDFNFLIGDIICLPNNTNLEITDIVDARCPCEVACIWEGEFIFNVSITKDGLSEDYELHEKIENERPEKFDFEFVNMALISDDTCENPIPLDEMVFQMAVEN